MRRMAQLGLFVALAVTTALAQEEVIDRIVASVDRRAILLSEWQEAVAFEALANGRPVASVTEDERGKTLQRMIDQELIREHMNGAEPEIPGEQVERRLAELRASFPTDEAWQSALAGYGLSEESVRERLKAQITLLLFIEQRLRPSVRVDASAVERYYRETLLPELKRAGAPEAPLTEVTPRIEELLIQQRISELLDAWLHNLREQTSIRVR